MNIQRQQTGFTLIEVLVAVVVMSVGILGVAGLQVISLQQNRSAMLRAEALQIGNDMLDRMRANPNEDYAPVTFAAAPASPNDCVAGACTAAQMASYDIAQWKCSINSEDGDGDQYAVCEGYGIVGSLPGGEASITETDGIHEVIVRWTDTREGTLAQISLQTRTRTVEE
jgi:type IV pilus assembly protein PilV